MRTPPRQAGHKDDWGGAYFVTFNACDRIRDGIPRADGPLGKVEGRTVALSIRGKILKEVWESLPVLFSNVELGPSVIMPDHIHGLLHLRWTGPGSNAKPKPLGQVVGALKSLSSKKMNEHFREAGIRFWQLGFYDRIVRDERYLARVKIYIQNNPHVLNRRVAAYAREYGRGELQLTPTIFTGEEKE